MASLIPSANASGTGSMTLAGPSTNSNQTVNIPDTTGTMMVSGNMPAFSAYNSSSTTLNTTTWTKITLQTEVFDTNSNFDSTTNYRFTPTVAGYYQVSATIQYAGDATTGAAIYKNGSSFKTGHFSSLGQGRASTVSALINFNGSTDYVEFYAFCNVTGTLTNGVSTTWFQAAMVRSA
jgi:hypothetical protein